MAYPRYRTVPPGEHGIYHCTSRCVRRAFLCGSDPLTGRSFEHRKQWLEERILELPNSFAVAVHAYAIMDNHLHVIVEVDPHAARRWSDREVASRWLALNPSIDDDARVQRLDALLEQPERIATLRQRLASLSWFMRELKQPIARRANREDHCTGRFWDGRFDSQSLLDDPALLTTMVYVDLNPVRAGLCLLPEHATHTSVHRRLRLNPDLDLDQPMRPLASSIHSRPLSITTAQYLRLLDWTGRTLHPHKRGAIPPTAPPILHRLDIPRRRWLLQVLATETAYRNAIGHPHALEQHARTLGQKWLRGITTARALEAICETT